mmetsp:Transcript_58589/g.156845  ORF Transcript_58589/g.156845 Transcript_58589/m.156845 type:complete len:214 (-) Transcript_58589:130-771(-)
MSTSTLSVVASSGKHVAPCSFRSVCAISSHSAVAECALPTPQMKLVPRRMVMSRSAITNLSSWRCLRTVSAFSNSLARPRFCMKSSVIMPNRKRALSAKTSVDIRRVLKPNCAWRLAISRSSPSTSATSSRAKRTRVSSPISQIWPKSMRPILLVLSSIRMFPGCGSELKRPLMMTWCPWTRQMVRLNFTGSNVGKDCLYSRGVAPKRPTEKL